MEKEKITNNLKDESENDDHVEEPNQVEPIDKESKEIFQMEKGNIKLSLGSSSLRVDLLIGLAMDFMRWDKKESKEKTNGCYTG